VGPVHLERAGSLQRIVEAKRELVEALPSDGHAALNIDDSAVAGMASHTAARVWRFGTKPEADVQASEVSSRGVEGFDFTLAHEGASRRVRMSLPGTHLVTNALAAATAGFIEGFTLDEVATALEGLRETPRLRITTLPNGATLLDDTYNANPASMEAALDLLGTLPGRKIALLGDMRELGELSRPSHQRIGHRAANIVGVLYTVGELSEELSDAAREAGLARTQHLDSKELAVELLRATLRPGDVLLVKGSRALALETVVQALMASSEPGRAS
jgi:UDP-N-acetylmuramoyl-tripeptide--D-alanyl-D-alanine ligase